MSKVCAICEKGPVAGRKYSRRGMGKAKGGAGIKVTRKSVRRFLPNLQRIKILLAGVVKTVYVCTKCIKSGMITKA